MGGGGGEGSGGAEGEGVVIEGWEVDVGVRGDPVETFLDAGDFETDEAVEDSCDGIVEDGAAEGVIEDGHGLVDESVQGVVDGAGGGVDPTE